MARLKIGIIGCGAIAQIQHLPHLRELDDEFEIGGLADLSPKLLEAVGADYGVPAERRFLDYRRAAAERHRRRDRLPVRLARRADHRRRRSWQARLGRKTDVHDRARSRGDGRRRRQGRRGAHGGAT